MISCGRVVLESKEMLEKRYSNDLCNIHSFVIKWIEEVSTIVNDLSLTPSQCLSCLKQKRDEQQQG